MISKIKKKVLQTLADQLAQVLYSVKQNGHFPLRYPIVLMSLISLIIRLFVTQNILISSCVSLFFASAIHSVITFYIALYILPEKKIMDKAIKFIKDNKDSF